MVTFLHTMLRVKNLEDSIKFYTEILAMNLLRKTDYPEGKFTLAFLGYDNPNSPIGGHQLELTYNWGVDNYELGTAYVHLAFGVKDIYKTCEEVRQKGIKITREPGPMKGSTNILAFIEDPNGYKIELIEKK
ncbi:putative lactoylglutathione lyase [Candidatus Hepatincolaceae symbiont of Richtersius coronifer]